MSVLLLQAFSKKLKIWKGDNVITFAQDVINKILSLAPNDIVDVVIWPKFDSSSITTT